MGKEIDLDEVKSHLHDLPDPQPEILFRRRDRDVHRDQPVNSGIGIAFPVFHDDSFCCLAGRAPQRNDPAQSVRDKRRHIVPRQLSRPVDLLHDPFHLFPVLKEIPVQVDRRFPSGIPERRQFFPYESRRFLPVIQQRHLDGKTCVTVPAEGNGAVPDKSVLSLHAGPGVQLQSVPYIIEPPAEEPGRRHFVSEQRPVRHTVMCFRVRRAGKCGDTSRVIGRTPYGVLPF